MKMGVLDWIVWILLFVGGLNWGLVGLFGYDLDLVAKIFGGVDGVFAKIVYILVGLAALWSLVSMFTKSTEADSQ